jgi:hypothetical protein
MFLNKSIKEKEEEEERGIYKRIIHNFFHNIILII